MEKPITPDPETAAVITRYGSLKEFKTFLEQFSSEQICNLRRQECKSNMLHMLAFPIMHDELYEYNQDYKNYHSTTHLARIHTIKADLLLRKCGSELLHQKTSTGRTPAIVAARTSYLPVLARIMLSSPTDWPFVVFELAPESSKILISNFLEMLYIKHLYPTISSDLHVELPQPQVSKLYNWAQNAHATLGNKTTDTPPLEKLSLKELKYVFEGYVWYDIHNQYRANRGNPVVEAYFNHSLSK